MNELELLNLRMEIIDRKINSTIKITEQRLNEIEWRIKQLENNNKIN